MVTRLQSLLSAFLCLALLAKMVALRVGSRPTPQAPLLLTALGSFAVAALVGIPAVRARIPIATVPGVASIIMDTGVSVSLALLATYLWAPLRRAGSVPWWRGRLFLTALAVSGLLAALMASTPPSLRTNPLQNQYTGDWRIVGVYVIGNLFFLACSGASAIACARIVRMVRGHIAVGVAVGAVGMVAYAVTCVNRLLLVAGQPLLAGDWFTWYSVLNFVFTEAAVLASVLGLHFTAVWRVTVGCQRIFDDLRAFLLLGPAWRRLTVLCPDVVLPWEPGPRGLRDRLDLSYRRYRREIECQDALLLTGAHPAKQPRPSPVRRPTGPTSPVRAATRLASLRPGTRRR
ncbi:MAB_1171c family putative transporter [Streptomyces lavendulae]|uniref:MAB_1171c family putative transporter n=1 Tax=Streptomyces lavendulae TaxID=1914 RepID=UPI00370F7702